MTVFAVTEERNEWDGSITRRLDSIWSTMEKTEERFNELVKKSDGFSTFDIEEIELNKVL